MADATQPDLTYPTRPDPTQPHPNPTRFDPIRTHPDPAQPYPSVPHRTRSVSIPPFPKVRSTPAPPPPPVVASSGVKLSYKSSGVDIDEGNALVEAIKPLAKGTLRPGVMGSIGGFGGLFDPAAAGFTDPILVAGTDGVGTKLLIAQQTDLHDTIGIDLVAMVVNDLVVQV